MREFWKKLKSIKLGITLIVILTVTSILATLVPQGLASEEYFELYSKLLAEIVVQTGFNRFFSSILFFIPALLLFINLGACTLDRLLRELKKKKKHRHGPDILHIGLLVLIVGGIISFSGRKEGMVRLSAGESVSLPGGEILRLLEFSDERYEDGRPKDWTSLVNLEKDGEVLKKNVEIRVNQPLRIGAITIYQSSYSVAFAVAVSAPDGSVTTLAKGGSFEADDLRVFFMTTELPSAENEETMAVLRVLGGGIDGAVRVGSQGRSVGGYTIATTQVLTTGLQAVSDPGYPFVLASLVLIGLGTALTFAQKMKDLLKEEQE